VLSTIVNVSRKTVFVTVIFKEWKLEASYQEVVLEASLVCLVRIVTCFSLCKEVNLYGLYYNFASEGVEGDVRYFASGVRGIARIVRLFCAADFNT